MPCLVAIVMLVGGCQTLGLDAWGGGDKPASARIAPSKADSSRNGARAGASQAQSSRAIKPKRSAKLREPNPSSDDLDASSTDIQGMLATLDRMNAAGVTTPAPAAEASEPTAIEPLPTLATPSQQPDQQTQPRTTEGAPITPPASMMVSTTAVAASPSVPEQTPAPLTPTQPIPEPTPAPVPTEVPSREAGASAAPAGAPAATPSIAPAQAPVTAGLSISALAFCSKVESFGKYTPLSKAVFQAGRSPVMIVYTELSGFTQTPEMTGDYRAFTTELTQTIELYVDADGSKQFAIPAQSVREVTRSPRKDFYLVQHVELPRNLTVGKYNLKVRVTDVATGQEAEQSKAIEIIADPQSVGK